jgi:hypothetical protein
MNFFFIFLNFFDNFVETQTDRRSVWPASEWCQQAPVKISDFLDTRAKSYARFTDGTSSYDRDETTVSFLLRFIFFLSVFFLSNRRRKTRKRSVTRFVFFLFFFCNRRIKTRKRPLTRFVFFSVFFLRNRRRKTRKRC